MRQTYYHDVLTGKGRPQPDAAVFSVKPIGELVQRFFQRRALKFAGVGSHRHPPAPPSARTSCFAACETALILTAD